MILLFIWLDPLNRPHLKSAGHMTGGKFGAGEGTRTPDLVITNDPLYQLSYTGEWTPIQSLDIGNFLGGDNVIRCIVFFKSME